MKEHFKIKEELEEGKILYSDAFEKIKKLPKPWHTKEWKLKRGMLLKGYCEQCGKTDVTLVLQHFSHPPKFKDTRKDIFEYEFRTFLEKTELPQIEVSEKEIESFIKKEVEIREFCPKCLKQSIKRRKTKQPLFLCSSCSFEFDIPQKMEYILSCRKKLEEVNLYEHLQTQKERTQIYELRNRKYQEWDEKIGKEALLKSIEASIEYQSMNNIATFCKTCAFNMDRRNRLLCYSCKENYFNFDFYDVCYECSLNKKEVIKNPFKRRII